MLLEQTWRWSEARSFLTGYMEPTKYLTPGNKGIREVIEQAAGPPSLWVWVSKGKLLNEVYDFR